MAEPHNIALVVGANIDPLRRDMRQATSTVGDFATKSRENLNVAGKAFIAFGATAAAGLAALYMQGAKLIDQQAKSARALGGTTEAFQALTYAADLAGISASSVESDMRRLNRELANPSERTTKTLDDLGLSARELLSLDIDSRVAMMADRFRELGYTTAQTDAAMRDLGLRNSELSKMFLDGGQQIRDAREELQAWGFAISDIDAAKVEAANDAFSRVRQVFSGIAQTIAVQLAPYVEALTRQFTEAAKEGGGVGAIVGRAMNSVVSAVGFAADAVEGIRRAFVVTGQGIAVFALGAQRAVLEFAAAIVQGPINQINRLITLINRLPGESFKLPTMEQPEFLNNIRSEIEMTRAAVAEGMADMQATLTQPMPSEGFKRWADDAVAEMNRVAAATVAARPGVGAGAGGDESATTEQRDPFMDEFSLGSEDAFATEQELFEEHWRRMNRIAVEGAGGVAQSIASNWGDAAGSTAAAGKSMFDSFSQNSRKMFEINKAWGIADALVSTAQGIAAGVRLGWPAGIPAVAWAAANGAAQISKIRSTSFGGGGSPAPVQSAPTSSAQQAPGTNNQGGQSPRTLRIEGFNAGSLYSGSQLENMAGALEEFWNDGGGKGRVIFADG